MQFDYVIVGGGSAGAVLANRLSARPGNRVALFEAGPDTPPDAVPDIIADSYPGLSYFDPRYHWTDLRVYNRSPRLNDGSARLSKLEQAKVMGGGSSINGQFAVRGLPVDYDGWEAMGLPGWGWSGMLPYFRKLERDLDFDGELHGKDGRIPIRRVFPEQWAGFTRDVLQAVEEEGPTYRPDYNATTEDGSFPLPLSNENERRVSTAIGYLDAETRKRPNLAIFPLTFVERIVFEGNRVKGLDIVRGGQRQRVEAGEVIVSSGALHSPAVLMRSGVGPAGHLKHHGIKVVADVPGVGENLTEHPHLAVGAHLKPPARLPRAMRRHIFLGVRYSSGVEGCDPGDMLLMPVNRAGWHPLGRSLGALNVCVNKSYSTGTVRLNSADPTVEPEVDLNLASDGRDLVRLVDGFKRLYRIMESPAVQAGINTWFLAGYTDAVRALSVRKPTNWLKTAAAAALFDYAPFARDTLIRRRFGTTEQIHAMARDDAAIAEWVKSTVWPGWHVSGTCRLGADGDPMAVLDARCRVRGVQGLRVVDASIMPSICSANTNITTIAIAEKAADLILNG
jgi:5-(hydroxymethyl)furfural/furfural oxidase